MEKLKEKYKNNFVERTTYTARKVRNTLQLSAFLAITPLAIPPADRLVDWVDQGVRGERIGGVYAKHPRVMRDGIIVSAVSADGWQWSDYPRAVYARFHPKLSTCLPREEALRHTGNAVRGVQANAECLSEITGVEENKLRYLECPETKWEAIIDPACEGYTKPLSIEEIALRRK